MNATAVRFWCAVCAGVALVPGQHESVTFKARVNRVTVPVVVRDREGNAVGGLRKEDFQLFDNGKRQEVAEFLIGRTGGHVAPAIAPARPSSAAATTGLAPVSPPPPIPDRFVALVFDDVHLRFEDLVPVRDAARRYLATSLAPEDRVALLTTSGKTLLDFTQDRARLDAELQKLRPGPVARGGAEKRCPEISFFLADQIDREDGPGGMPASYHPALDAAIVEVLVCYPNFPEANAQQLALAAARDAWTSGRFESRASLRVLSALVRRIETLPGERVILLVSPGFQLLTEHHAAEMAVIERAIRSGVVINALDARGLFEISPAGEIDDRPLQFSSRIQTMQRERIQFREAGASASAAVMFDLAAGTGGRFIENSNDFGGAFRKLAAAPEYVYVLGFSPTGLKPDGRFHRLKVRLINSRSRTVQARRGYFAPGRELTAAEMVNQTIEDAVFSREEIHLVPVELSADVSGAQLQVTARLIAIGNPNELTVIAALFDADGNYISGHQNVVQIAHAPVEVRAAFDAKAGSYLVRFVAANREGQLVTAASGSVVVP